MSHTPGPWKVVENVQHTFRPNNQRYIYHEATDLPLGIAFGKDDARLIAAAPDLLAALEACLGYIENEAAALDMCVDNWPIVKNARAEIAKARGQ